MSPESLQEKWATLAALVKVKRQQVFTHRPYSPRTKKIDRVSFRSIRYGVGKTAKDSGLERFRVTFTLVGQTEFGETELYGAVKHECGNWYFYGLCEGQHEEFFKLCQKEAESL